jgi:serine/threonine protein kinase/Flp pilus assembly protein TadD
VPALITIGQQLGRYEIRSKIGEGGMGEVYLAEDTRLHRNVALKILPPDLAANKDRMRRFEQEATAAAALNHPNVAHIYEIGESNGVNFIAMEFIDGATLRAKIHQERADLRRLLRCLQHVAEGLAKAHAAGIVHRDLKPDNIMITRDGYAKILDFGLAKLLEPKTLSGGDSSEVATAVMPQHSTPGAIMGTVGYMSPEQAQGRVKEIDHRADIFSFGCILFESATGKKPFEGDSVVKSLHMVIYEAAPSITELNPALPADLQRIVRRCLAKDPDERYQSIKDVAIELKELRRELEGSDFDTTVPPPAKSKTSSLPSADETFGASTGTPSLSTRASSAEYVVSGIKQHKLAAIVTVLVVLGGVVAIILYLRGRPTNAAIKSIAVMPFVNTTGNADLEYLSDGITESLINNLSQLSTLSVKARSSTFRYKGKDVEPQQVASDLKVQAVLNGRVAQRGDNLTISLDLVDGTTGNQIWGEQYSRTLGDLASLQGEIARDVSQKLRFRLTNAEETRVVKNQTQNAEAYQLYLQGRYNWNKRTGPTTDKAIQYFQQAIVKDPNYAMAYVGLAESYSIGDIRSDERFAKVKAAALKAIEIDPTLGEPHAALAGTKDIYERDLAGAEKEYKRAIELNPNYATSYHWYGETLSEQGRFDEGLPIWKRALELDPFSLAIGTDYALEYLYYDRKYEQAVDYLNKLVEMDPNYVRTHTYLTIVYETMGRYEDAINETEKRVSLQGMKPEEVANAKRVLSDALKAGGPKGYWSKILEFTMQDMKKGESVPAFVLARIYSELGQRDEAFKWLQKSFENKETDLVYIKVSPIWDKLRDDPRFADMLRRLGFSA